MNLPGVFSLYQGISVIPQLVSGSFMVLKQKFHRGETFVPAPENFCFSTVKLILSGGIPQSTTMVKTLNIWVENNEIPSLIRIFVLQFA